MYSIDTIIDSDDAVYMDNMAKKYKSYGTL